VPDVPDAERVPAILRPVTIDVPDVFVEAFVKVRFIRFPVAAAATAREESANVFMFPVVVVEVIDVVPKPVKAMLPDVPVRESAPVVSVRPFEAVRVPAEVIVPLLVVDIVPDVVIASPELEGERVVPDLDQ